MWRIALRHGSVGLEMGLAVGLGYWLGQWLDSKFDTSPYLMLAMLLLGIATAFRAIIRVAQEVNRANDEDGNSDGSEEKKP